MHRLPWLDEVENLTLRLPGMAATVLLLLGLMLILAGIRLMRPHKPLFTLNGKQTVLLLLGIVVMGVVILLALPLTEEWGGLWEIREVLLGRGQDSFGSYRLGCGGRPLHCPGNICCWATARTPSGLPSGNICKR